MQGTAWRRFSGHDAHSAEPVGSTCWRLYQALYPLSGFHFFFKKSSQVFGEAERSLDLKKEVWIEILNAFNALSPHVKPDLN